LAENTKVLGPTAIDASVCTDLHQLAAQVQTALDGLPVADPGPGPDGNPYVPVEPEQSSRICLTSDFTGGVASAVLVDEYYVAIPAKPAITLDDPTREIYHGGTITVTPQGGGSSVQGTAAFPDWSTEGMAITFVDDILNTQQTYTVATWNSATELILTSTTASRAVTESYVLRQATGDLEGTGNGTCGFVNVKTTDGGSVVEVSPVFEENNWIVGGGGATLTLVTGTADALILPGASGDCTVASETTSYFNASGQVVWKGSAVLVDSNKTNIISADSATILSANAMMDGPTLITHFDSWEARSHGTFDETGIGGGTLSDPLSLLVGAQDNDRFIFTAGSFLGALRFTVVNKPARVAEGLGWGITQNQIPAATDNLTPGKRVNGIEVLRWDGTTDNWEADPDIGILDAYNGSRTAIGSGVVMYGFISEVGVDDTRFICMPFDMRSLPGFVAGSVPGGSDDPDMQVPYHSGGQQHFKLDSEDCGA
jgi:hypothetical protein